MKDILVSLFLVSSVVAGASETAGVTNFMQGENPVEAAVRAFTSSDAPFASVAPVNASGARSSQTMFVAYTDGSGVRSRSACSADASGAGSIAEGTSVQVVRVGGAECPGWALVSAGGTESWVRMTYLNASNPANPGSRSAGFVSNKGGVASQGSGTGTGAPNGGIGGGGPVQSQSGGVANAPLTIPNLGIAGISNGQGWTQVLDGGQAPQSIQPNQSSAPPAPGSPAPAGSVTTGNGQGWGQGVGGGQDHLSSGLPEVTTTPQLNVTQASATRSPVALAPNLRGFASECVDHLSRDS
jgi:hypothetical protein